MKPMLVMPWSSAGACTVFESLEKYQRTASTNTMDRPKVTSSWSSCGRA